MGSKDLELVRSGLKLRAGHLGDLSGNGLIKPLEGIQTSADGSSTLSEIAEVRQGRLNTLNVAVQLRDITRELLAESERSGVLQMGTADLDDVLEVLHLLLESITQALKSRKQGVLDFQDGGNVHGSGERVVGRRGHINVVIGVDWLLGALYTSEDLNGTIGDYFVRVHVGLGAGTSLPND